MSLTLPKKKERSKSGRTVLIDGDPIVYAVAFASKDDPIEHCLHSVKVFINRIIESTDAEYYKLFLTGKGNFREDLATIKPYKGNRKKEKPEYYQPIRDYMVEAWGAIVAEGLEADDLLSIEMMKAYKEAQDD